MKLYTRPASYRAQKIIIAAQFVDAPLEIDATATEAVIKSKSAIAKLPLLETSKGCISESNAIARYIANTRPESGLAGVTLLEKGQVDSWIDFSSNELEIPASVLVYPVIGWMAYHKEATERAHKDFKSALSVLESHLKSRTFMVGNSITLADIALSCSLLLPMKLILDEKARKPFPCVTRWFLTLVNQPQFKKVVGEVVLCKVALTAPGAQESAKPDGKKKGKEKGKEKGGDKKEAKAKQEAEPKKQAAPAATSSKKPKHPLESLPPSKFSLDAWKKQYSNAPGGDCYKAMPWFWENYDSEGFSIYHGTYRYNDELKVPFMVSNLAGGFVQRCDEIRKYAFGVIQIVGQDGGPIEILQTWLFRGPSEKHLLEANPDAEHYEWTRVTDLNDAEKKKVEDMWCAWETIEGKPILDAKIFK